jgi:hypothetical protein
MDWHEPVLSCWENGGFVGARKGGGAGGLMLNQMKF